MSVSTSTGFIFYFDSSSLLFLSWFCINNCTFQLLLNYYPCVVRLPPPDFHPPTTNCPEETLTKDYVLAGYRETVEGLEVCCRNCLQVNLSVMPYFICNCFEHVFTGVQRDIFITDFNVHQARYSKVQGGKYFYNFEPFSVFTLF